MSRLFRPRPWSQRTPKAAQSRLRRQMPNLEALEGRQLLALVGPEFTVNASARAQFQPHVASSPGGQSVVVWEEQVSSTNIDIFAQRYNASGSPVGLVVPVEVTGANATQPSVAMDATGDFVVTWSQKNVGSSQQNIVAQRFSSSGSKLGEPINVANSAQFEFDSDVAMDDAGNFVVSYTKSGGATSQDVCAKRFSSNGTTLGSTIVAATTASEAESSVTMERSTGRFAVAYRTTAGSNTNVCLKRYFFSAGNQIGTTTRVATGKASDPDVGVDNSGNFVVAYESISAANTFDIKARRVTAFGSLSGSELNIASGGDNKIDPVVAVNRNTGSFVVAYESLSSDRVRVVEVSTVLSGNVITKVGDFLGADDPAISSDTDGDYVVTFKRASGADTNIHGRRGRRV